VHYQRMHKTSTQNCTGKPDAVQLPFPNPRPAVTPPKKTRSGENFHASLPAGKHPKRRRNSSCSRFGGLKSLSDGDHADISPPGGPPCKIRENRSAAPWKPVFAIPGRKVRGPACAVNTTRDPTEAGGRVRTPAVDHSSAAEKAPHTRRKEAKKDGRRTGAGAAVHRV